jgi:hypothetical protein
MLIEESGAPVFLSLYQLTIEVASRSYIDAFLAHFG